MEFRRVLFRSELQSHDNLVSRRRHTRLSCDWSFKEEAGKIPGVLSISKMRNSPTDIEHHTGSISWENKDPNLTISFADAVVGYDFTKTMNVKLKSGRDFSNSYGTDSLSFIVNETAVKKIDYVNPVGRSITWGNHKGKIIGVLE